MYCIEIGYDQFSTQYAEPSRAKFLIFLNKTTFDFGLIYFQHLFEKLSYIYSITSSIIMYHRFTQSKYLIYNEMMKLLVQRKYLESK